MKELSQLRMYDELEPKRLEGLTASERAQQHLLISCF